MMIDIVNKILIFLLFLAILNIIRNSFFLIRTFGEKERFILNKPSLISLGISMAYVLMAIIDKVKIE